MEGDGGKMGPGSRRPVLVQHKPHVRRRAALYVLVSSLLRRPVASGPSLSLTPATAHLSNEPPQFAESDLQTVDAIVEDKRKQLDAKLKAREAQATKKAEATPQQTPSPTDRSAVAAPAPEEAEKTPEQLEEEAGQQGAFNPETGEINFDCPCLGGMAHGPCGEEFKAAFSCFVYSEQEPKGIECVDKFQYVMQNPSAAMVTTWGQATKS